MYLYVIGFNITYSKENDDNKIKDAAYPNGIYSVF